MTDQTSITPTVRHDGWTRERKAQFLDHLGTGGNVRTACARVGMSREAAYRLRRRDVLFARGWDAALVLARTASAEVLANRAIDGVIEEVWYRGELVGSRRKYDSRLLLAHMARLDKQADDRSAARDAGRFDELLALVGGETVPEDVDCDGDGVPVGRHEAAERAAEDARLAFHHAWLDEQADRPVDDEYDLLPDEERREREFEAEMAHEADCEEVAASAWAEAAVRWDTWLAQACGAVDRLLDPVVQPADRIVPAGNPGTVSNVSTSPGASALDAAAA